MIISLLLDVQPRSLEQPLWSSVASQSISHTQPIGSKPIIAATSSTISKGTWNTDLPTVQSFKVEAPSILSNFRNRKDLNFVGDGQVEGIQMQGSNHYRTSDNIGFQTTLDKVN